MKRRFAIALSVSYALWVLSILPAAARQDPDAVFNVQSKIYHRASCSAARRCTRNCIVIKLSEARKRGGRACKICGGPVTERDHVQHAIETKPFDGKDFRGTATP